MPSSQQQQQQQQRHQGRILRLHFTCHAPLPIGTTLRVTSSIGPPPQKDTPGDEDTQKLVGDAFDDQSVASDSMGISGGMNTNYNGGGNEAEEAARLHNRLLQNTVEMYTTPEDYPIWKTRRPVVVIDEGGQGNDDKVYTARSMGTNEANNNNDNEGDEKGLVGAPSSGPILHRYRYVAVTPGATIDWTLCKPREFHDDGRSRFVPSVFTRFRNVGFGFRRRTSQSLENHYGTMFAEIRKSS